jgi:glycosyltransferase involved in cell wall biosynthesis
VVDRTLLVVSQRPLELGGGGSARWRHLRRALRQHGWRVVECSPRVGLTTNESSTDPTAAWLAGQRAEVMAVAGRILDPFARVLRVKPEAFAPNNAWALTGRRLIRSAISRERPDVVLATAPPPSALLAAAAVAGEVPLVSELRDLWAGNPYFDRGSTILPALQRRALRRSAAIVTVTDGFRDGLLGVDPEIEQRLHVLPNGFDPALLAKRAPPTTREGPRTLIHAGALYGERTAESLLAALADPQLRGRAQLQLLGVTDPRTRRLLASTDVEVTVERPVSSEQAVERVLAADIAVVINAPGTGGDMALPSKLYEALALGRPVLALTGAGSDTALLLQRLGQDTGIAPPDDPAAIAAAIDRLFADPPPPVEPEALRDFDRDRVAARYAALLDEVATRSSSDTSSGTTDSRR